MVKSKLEEVADEYWEKEINDTNKELIEDFLSQKHLSKKTIKQYTSASKIFARWIHENLKPKGEVTIPQLRPRDARRYQDYLITNDIGSDGVRFKRSVVSSLCGFIELYYDDEYPDFRNIYSKAIPNVPKSKVKEKIPLTTNEINKIVEELEKREEWQKIAYVLFTYSTGCRREESRQLLREIKDYEVVEKEDKDGNIKRYYLTHSIRAKGKGLEGKKRKFKFDEKAMFAIKRWLEYRDEKYGRDDNPYVFVSNSKDGLRQVSENTFNNWCNSFSDFIDGKKVHPHLFRSSRATNAVIEEGKDIKAVQKLLGHNSSETTEIYVVRDSEDDDDDLF